MRELPRASRGRTKAGGNVRKLPRDRNRERPRFSERRMRDLPSCARAIRHRFPAEVRVVSRAPDAARSPCRGCARRLRQVP